MCRVLLHIIRFFRHEPIIAMNYQIKPMMNVEARDIESVVHPNHLKVYFRQLNIQPSFELMSHMHVLLVRGLAYEHRVIDHLGQVKNCVPV